MSFFRKPSVTKYVYLTATCAGFLIGWVGYAIQIGLGADIWNWLGVTLLALHLYFPRPNIVLDPDCNALVRFAAALSGFSGFVAAVLLWLAAANRTANSLYTQVLRRDHTVVIGHGEFARRFATALREEGHNLLHVLDPAHKSDGDEEVDWRVICALAPEDLSRRVRLIRASQIVIDLGSDTETLAVAKAVYQFLSAFNQPSHNIKRIAIHVSDPVLSDRFFEVATQAEPIDVEVSFFDENLITARNALASNPLFTRAAARDQARVHALIVGFGDLGEKLLDQVFLTSLAGDLGPPMVSILDRKACDLERAFRARRPRLMDADQGLDITFYEIDIGHHPLDDPNASDLVRALMSQEQAHPVTMIYLALPDQAEVTRAALLIDRLRDMTGAFRAPIAYRCRLASEGQDYLQLGSTDLATDQGFIRMGVSVQDTAQAILEDTETEALARLIHDDYERNVHASEDARRPWRALPQTYKRANRRAADHFAAKLWTACGAEPPFILSPNQRKTLETLRDAPVTDSALLRLAKLEHDRWSIDRRLDGWIFAPTRDNQKRLHPLLTDFEDISKSNEELEKDLRQLRVLLTYAIENAR